MFQPLTVERRTPLPVSAAEAYDWHLRPGALERLIPPWQRVDVLERSLPLAVGAPVRLLVHAGPIRVTWTLEHSRVELGREFTDVQVHGPFRQWEHEHGFESGSEGLGVLSDRITCALPTGLAVAHPWLARELRRLLAYRHRQTTADLAMHARAAGTPRLHVAVTGASGLVGSLLIPALTSGGHRVTRIVRRVPGAGEIRWDPDGTGLDPELLRGIDAVVHLAGENLASGRWTAARKRRIFTSRKTGTRLIADAIARAPDGPRILVSAGAIGYYGDRGDETLTEDSEPGRGFLPETAIAWEAGTGAAERAGVRVVHLRMGLVLTPRGGLLQRMGTPFRLGIGGRLGHGRQWMSWISADDLIGVFLHALTSAQVKGPVNAVAPGTVRNTDFTAELARALHRPALMPVPAIALRALFGEMADEAILASARVRPGVLAAMGFQFRHPSLGGALAHLLGLPEAR